MYRLTGQGLGSRSTNDVLRDSGYSESTNHVVHVDRVRFARISKIEVGTVGISSQVHCWIPEV